MRKRETFTVKGTKRSAAVVVSQELGFEKIQIMLYEIGGPRAKKDCTTLAKMLNSAMEEFQEMQDNSR